jgi:hypothetical protein
MGGRHETLTMKKLNQKQLVTTTQPNQYTEYLVAANGTAWISQSETARLCGVARTTLQSHLVSAGYKLNKFSQLCEISFVLSAAYFSAKGVVKASKLVDKLLVGGGRAYIYTRAGYRSETQQLLESNAQVKLLTAKLTRLETHVDLVPHIIRMGILPEDCQHTVKGRKQMKTFCNRIGSAIKETLPAHFQPAMIERKASLVESLLVPKTVVYELAEHWFITGEINRLCCEITYSQH